MIPIIRQIAMLIVLAAVVIIMLRQFPASSSALACENKELRAKLDQLAGESAEALWPKEEEMDPKAALAAFKDDTFTDEEKYQKLVETFRNYDKEILRLKGEIAESLWPSEDIEGEQLKQKADSVMEQLKQNWDVSHGLALESQEWRENNVSMGG